MRTNPFVKKAMLELLLFFALANKKNLYLLKLRL